MSTKHGRMGEKVVSAILKQQGWHIYEENFRAVGSEIDLIAHKGDTIVFVEVKLRSGYGPTLDASAILGKKKRAALKRGARLFLKKKKVFFWKTLRFDLAIVRIHKEYKASQKPFSTFPECFKTF